MIKSIHFENFFSFRDTKIELNSNDNILIGINGSGKSNFLKAIQLLKEGVTGNHNRGRLICIDEPEVGLHPDMILGITNAIKEASGETQFIIATHSENILSNFELENIRVFEKNENNETTIVEFSKEDLRDGMMSIL